MSHGTKNQDRGGQSRIPAAALANIAPETRASMHAEGYAAGVALERARIKAIDDLDLRGVDSLVMEAKYGKHPSNAGVLAAAVVKAGRVAGIELLKVRS